MLSRHSFAYSSGRCRMLTSFHRAAGCRSAPACKGSRRACHLSTPPSFLVTSPRRSSYEVPHHAQRPRPVVNSTRRPQVAEKDQQTTAEQQLVEVDKVIERETKGEQLAALVGAAVAFGAGIWYVQGSEKAQEYFAGYLLEQSLSIDNLFVFILVFNYFQTPPELQSKVLTYGLATAAILRAVMIVLGVELIQNFEPLLLVFAGILLYSSFQLLVEADDEDEDLSKNSLVRFCQKLIPVSTSYDGDKFFTVENGVKTATPLLLVLAIIELSDVVFAVDSIPAVFGVTLDPLIVYSSNLFAIISLRSLYSFVSSMMGELRFLDKAVALVLGFIGLKMVGDFVDINIPTDVSLLVVATVLGGGVGLSLLLPENEGD